MAPRTYYGQDWLDDLKALRARGLTIAQAAAELGMGKATADRLLAADRAAQKTDPRPSQKKGGHPS